MDTGTKIEGGICCSGGFPPPIQWRHDLGAYQCGSCMRIFCAIEENLERSEARIIRQVMDLCGGVLAHASLRLGISRHRLRLRLKRYRIHGRKPKGEST